MVFFLSRVTNLQTGGAAAEIRRRESADSYSGAHPTSTSQSDPTAGPEHPSVSPTATRYTVDWSAPLEQILRDAAGFLALYPLFLLVVLPDLPVLPVDGVIGMNWGDAEGRKAAVARRQLRLCSEMLKVFSQSNPVTPESLCRALATDDERQSTEHYTEF
eukprot:gene1895-2235_t